MKHEIVLAACVDLAQQAELELVETRAGVTDTDESQLSAERKLRQALARIAQCEADDGGGDSPSPLIFKLHGRRNATATLISLGWTRVPNITNLRTLEDQINDLRTQNTWYAILAGEQADEGLEYWNLTWTEPRATAWTRPNAGN